jgi:spermidine/putrescine transport system permease protein
MPRRLCRLYIGAVYLFLYTPILVLVVYSFNASRLSTQWTGFTLAWYRRLAANQALLEAAGNSLIVAVSAATIATVLGTLAAMVIYRYRFKGRGLINGGLYVLTVSPDIVMGISLLVLFVGAGLPLGFTTLLLGHVTFCLPFAAITVMARLKGFNAHLVEAAQDLGADEVTIFRRIVFPLIWPAVLAGWLLSFTLSLDDVMVSFFITGPGFEILPLRIYSMVRLGVKPEINALCAILLVFTFIVVLVAWTLTKERNNR